MNNKSWKDNNYLTKFNESSYESVDDLMDTLGNKISKAIRNNSDKIAYIFYEKIADYLWDNYDIDDLKDMNIDDIVYDWFVNNYDI